MANCIKATTFEINRGFWKVKCFAFKNRLSRLYFFIIFHFLKRNQESGYKKMTFPLFIWQSKGSTFLADYSSSLLCNLCQIDTVWKIKEFSTRQTFTEMNFGATRFVKIANFIFWWQDIYRMWKIWTLKNCSNLSNSNINEWNCIPIC